MRKDLPILAMLALLAAPAAMSAQNEAQDGYAEDGSQRKGITLEAVACRATTSYPPETRRQKQRRLQIEYLH